MKFSQFLLSVSSLILLLLTGCGSNGQIPGTPSGEQSGTDIRIETRTDTVSSAALPMEDLRNLPPALSEASRFMVQVGAYHDPERANEMQGIARGRFVLPVINEFDAQHGVYKIRIGFFNSREEAEAFREKIRHDFPADYVDAWIVAPGSDDQ